MITEYIEDLRSGKLPKGKFIGKYIQQINQIFGKEAFRYKRPQVIGEGKEANNNWLDYIINMPDDEYEYFKTVLH